MKLPITIICTFLFFFSLIVLRDFVVVAVASAVHGELLPAVLGILVSVPCIVWFSKVLLPWINRFPVIVLAGAAMLGWISAGLLLDDRLLSRVSPDFSYPIKLIGGSLVVLFGSAWRWFSAHGHASEAAHSTVAKQP